MTEVARREETKTRAARGSYALALHGGAGSAPAHLAPDECDDYERTLTKILRMGQALLAGGGTSLDCVEQVVRALEDDPKFNAGRGAVLNFEGEPELDAAIMDGRTRACGAVAAVRTVRNPISLARRVMTGSRHVLLAADGAEQFADEVGVERAAPDYFRTARRIESWQRARDAWRASGSGSEEQLGTVGCVALDVAGNLAAATSTGGLTLKRFGRIGDSPLIGAGNYADNTCAVSGTGQGEEFIRHVVAYDVAARMRYGGATLTAAVQAIVGEVLKPGDGGLIAVARDGELVMAFNTEGMYRAAADSRGRFEVGLGREAAR